MTKIVNSFSYFYDIAKIMVNNGKADRPKIHTINWGLSGSRLGAKTVNGIHIPIIEFACLERNVGATIWRYEPNSATETFDEFMATACDLYDIEGNRDNSNMSKRRLKICGNEVVVRGYLSNRKKSKPRLGIARKGIKKLYQINAFDEISEFPEKENLELIKQGTGGAKIVLNIMATNPGVSSHGSTKVMANEGMFDEELLRKKGEVFKSHYDKETKTLNIFHVTNHRINEFLTEGQHQGLLSTGEMDANFARVVDLGLPGVQEGLVYNSNLPNVQQLKDLRAHKFVMGLDGGTSQGVGASATHLVMGFFEEGYKTLTVDQEFKHSNKGGNYWDDNKIVKELLRRVYEYIDSHREAIIGTQYKVSLRYDWAAMTLGTLLKNEGINMRNLGVFDAWVLNQLDIRPCTKYEIPTRINALNTIIGQRRLHLDRKICRELGAELESCQGEETRLVKGQATRKDGQDDGINALEYLISDDLFAFVDKRFIEYYKRR